MRTIKDISNFMPLVEKKIKEKWIPALFNGFVPISDEFRKLLAHPCKLGVMGIIDPTKNTNDECTYLRDLTSQQLTSSIKQQELRYRVLEENIKNCHLSKSLQ